MDNTEALTKKEICKLSIQNLLCFLSMFIFYPLMYFSFYNIFRYRVNDLKIIRKEFQEISKKTKGTILICPNHLTYIDSIIIMIIFGSFWNYLLNFHTYAWNFPTLKNMKKNWFYLFICYFGRCQIIDRQGSSEKIKKTMQKASYLMSIGDYIMIFPEGTRSKTGRVDTENFVYGVGNLLINTPETKTLCVYLRGSLQKKSSNYPSKGDDFYCRLRLIEPKTTYKGIRAARDLSTQIIQNLAQMESEYFTSKN